MFNFAPIKKQIAIVIRKEMAETRDRYARACNMLGDIVNNDNKVDPLDKAQRKWDLGKELWSDVYEPYYEELSDFLKEINKAHNSYDES